MGSTPLWNRIQISSANTISQKTFGFSLLKTIQSESSTARDVKGESRLTGESSALFQSRCEPFQSNTWFSASYSTFAKQTITLPCSKKRLKFHNWHLFTANSNTFKQMQLWKDFGLYVGGCVSWAFQIENNWPESNILLKQPRTYLRKNHWPFRTFLRHRKLNPVLFPKQFKMSSLYPFHCPPAPCTVCCIWI